LREMVRVLAPGGKLVLAFNTWVLSLEYLLSSGQGKRDGRLGNLKDLLAGLALQTLDLQAKPGTFWGRSTPYLSRAWLRRQLRKLNCEVTWLGRETCFLGMATVIWVIIVKRDTRSEN